MKEAGSRLTKPHLALPQVWLGFAAVFFLPPALFGKPSNNVHPWNSSRSNHIVGYAASPWIEPQFCRTSQLAGFTIRESQPSHSLC